MEIKKLSELDSKVGAYEILVETVNAVLTKITKDQYKLALALEGSFDNEWTYVAVENNQILGIVLISSHTRRAFNFDKKKIIKYMGFFMGRVIYYILNREFPKELDYPGEFNFIEFIGVHPDYQGKGIATAMMNYVHDTLPSEKYLLEVIDTNFKAIPLYLKQGYKEFARKKERFFTKLKGFKYIIYMERLASAVAGNVAAEAASEQASNANVSAEAASEQSDKAAGNVAAEVAAEQASEQAGNANVAAEHISTVGDANSKQKNCRC